MSGEKKPINATVTLHIEVYDAQELWDQAKSICENMYSIGGFQMRCGTREAPDIAGCLSEIFDPNESLPGITIWESSAAAEAREDERAKENEACARPAGSASRPSPYGPAHPRVLLNIFLSATLVGVLLVLVVALHG